MEQLLKELQQEETQQQGLYSNESINLEFHGKFNKSSSETYNDFLKVKGRTLKEMLISQKNECVNTAQSM